ncbi:MAG: hypothetical protein ACI4SE_01800 [Lachnospiraceae bacterium]
MMQKSTDELLNELSSSKDIDNFMAENQTELLDITLSEYLRQLLEQYHLEKSKVFRRAKMTDNNYGYELFRDDTKKASRDKLIQICIGFPLTIEETQKVLRYGKVRPLYPRDQRDAYILFALKNQYDMDQLNDLLFEHNETIFE